MVPIFKTTDFTNLLLTMTIVIDVRNTHTIDDLHIEYDYKHYHRLVLSSH